MKTIKYVIACLILCNVQFSSAALYNRGNGLIYDDVLNITWLQDSNYIVNSGYDPDGWVSWQEK